MAAVELLNSRIKDFKEANAANQVIAAHSVLDKAKDRAVSQIEEITATAEEIFLDGDLDDEPDYVFRRVTGSIETATLIKQFSTMLNTRDRWPFDVWLDRANDHESTIIEVRRAGDPTPAGFAVMDADLLFEPAISKKGSNIICLSFDCTSVYVTPDQRGKGFSNALAWVAAEYASRATDAVARISKADQSVLGACEFEVFLKGEAHSTGGSSYLASVAETIDSNFQFISEEPWFKGPTIIDDIDYGAFPEQRNLGRSKAAKNLKTCI